MYISRYTTYNDKHIMIQYLAIHEIPLCQIYLLLALNLQKDKYTIHSKVEGNSSSSKDALHLRSTAICVPRQLLTMSNANANNNQCHNITSKREYGGSGYSEEDARDNKLCCLFFCISTYVCTTKLKKYLLDLLQTEV